MWASQSTYFYTACISLPVLMSRLDEWGLNVSRIKATKAN